MANKKRIKKQISNELKNTSYELFIAALSVLSIFNLIILWLIPHGDSGVLGVLSIMNALFSGIFLADFTYRIYTAKSRSGYFFHEFGWADLLASLPLPQLKILRFFRLFRAFRIMRMYGAKRLFREFLESRGGSALLSIFLLIILLLEFGGIIILFVEGKSPDANIKTPSDAIWWIIVTVTTVGYGDRFPVTNGGRMIGVLVMAVGIGLVGTLTGFLANAFLAPKKK
jgi:voltage-gated potassium channel Kch